MRAGIAAIYLWTKEDRDNTTETVRYTKKMRNQTKRWKKKKGKTSARLKTETKLFMLMKYRCH